MEEANRTVPIIDRRFCNPSSETTFTVKRKIGWFKTTFFNVTDAGGNLVFKVVKGGSFRFSSRNLLLVDAADSPVATLLNKRFWMQWIVYNGKSTTVEDELCLIYQGRELRSLHVLLTDRRREKKLSVVGNFLPVFYMDDKVIADVVENFVLGCRAGFKVRVKEGVDAAFILALFIVHRESTIYGRPAPVPIVPTTKPSECPTCRRRYGGGTACGGGGCGGGCGG